jgi:radical SAM protein with 4Fe4S-binding SPASM domain
MREAGAFGPSSSKPLDFVRVRKTLEEANQSFALFGGEPLLATLGHLEEVWRFGFEKYGRNGIQTNGLLINDAHLALFKKYNVQVGISIDGPHPINSARCDRAETNKIIENIERVLQVADISLITTIHKLSAAHLFELLDFFGQMEMIGIRDINLHNLEVDNCATDTNLRLSDEENFEVFKFIYDRHKESELKFNPFQDIRKLLTQDNPSVSCIWTNCDPVITPAVHGINAAGDLVNCGRTNKDGIDYLKSNSPRSLERYQALALTEQEDGGCRGCQYFFVCKGQCPGTAIDGDWRNKTKDCLFWYALIDYINKDIPCNQRVRGGNEKFLSSLWNMKNEDSHGDVPHGDWHGDFTDSPKLTNRVRKGELGLVRS